MTQRNVALRRDETRRNETGRDEEGYRACFSSRAPEREAFGTRGVTAKNKQAEGNTTGMIGTTDRNASFAAAGSCV